MPPSAAPHLFLVVLGGRSRGCHIEQHDVRFVAGQRIEDTIPALRRQWFGLQRGLHLDSWQRIERVEGWRVELRPEPFAEEQRLWFVNVGAYDPACMAELHAFGLFVAPSARSASARAKRHLLVGEAQQHKDDVYTVEAMDAGPRNAMAPPAAGGAATRRRQAGNSSTAASAHTDGVLEVDDVMTIERIGAWHVHLRPPEPGAAPADMAWQPLLPDWYGYRRIDGPQTQIDEG